MTNCTINFKNILGKGDKTLCQKNETNKVRLIGEVISEFTFNHEVFGEKFYFVSLSVTRLSGQVDDPNLNLRETYGYI